VTSRGDGRENIFVGDEDRAALLDLFGLVCERFNWICHAYCLMTDHYHLLVETVEGYLSKGMRQLNVVYMQYVNRTHRRVGHVFLGRYKAIVVEKDAYLLELARYVVVNPIRARMIAQPEDWPWSSYHATIGAEAAPTWLAVDSLLRGFGSARGKARKNYINFVRAGVGLPSVWHKLTGQIYLGGAAFVRRMGALAENRLEDLEVPRAQHRPVARPLSHYLAAYADRREGMAQAYATGDFTLAEVAQAFGVHCATVSRAIGERR
jgi:REP element-mobilizing transposase RayT